MKWRLVGCIGVLALGILPSAGAHLLGHRDGDDVRSRFDIKQTNMERVRRGEVSMMKVAIRTHDDFAKRDLSYGAFYVDIDSRGDRGRDFYVQMDNYEGSYPICDVYRESGTLATAGQVVVGDSYIGCTFQRSDLNQTKHLSWRARSSYGEARDSAPNGGWYRH